MQRFVLVRNKTESPAIFSDHRGTPYDLSALGTKGDTIKILLDEHQYEMQAKWYNGMKENKALHIQFSDKALDTVAFRKNHFVTAAPEAARERVEALRASLVADKRKTGSAQARLIRAKAEALIRQGKTVAAVETEISNTLDTLHRAPNLLDDPASDQVALTEESLLKLPAERLKAVAINDLKLEVRAGISKRGLVNLILNAGDGASRATDVAE